MEKTKTKTFSNLKFTLSKIQSLDKNFLFLQVVSVIFGTIAGFIPAFILKIIIDNLSVPGNLTNEKFLNIIIVISIISLVMFVLQLVSNWIDSTSWYRVVRVRMRLILELNEKILSFDYEELEKPNTQDLVAKARNCLGSNWNGFEGMYNYMKTVSLNIVSVIISSAIIFSAHFLIIIIVISMVIVKYLLKNYSNKINKKKFWDVIPSFRRKYNYVNRISNNFLIAKDLRLYKMRNFIQKEEKQVQKDIHKLLAGSETRRVTLQTVLTIIDIFQQLGIYAILVYQVIKGDIIPGTFTLMLAAVTKLSISLSASFINYADLVNCSRQVDDLINFLNLTNDLGEEACYNDSRQVTIEFKEVYYKYYEAEDYTLKDISFVIHPGEKLAIVGFNGAGKTTLIKLLMGLYHPTKGQILINGKDIELLSRESLFKIFSPVLQKTNVFNFTVKENIAVKFGDDVDEQKALEAMILAGLEEKINSLPKKMSTILMKELDEEGIELSGGESQKLSLARAIYKNSPVVVLDEPTSALDALAEYHMYTNFNKIINKSSAIFISHRLSSTHFCDKIIFLKDGKIKEYGSHEELMKNKQGYFSMFNVQAKYYKEEKIDA